MYKLTSIVLLCGLTLALIAADTPTPAMKAGLTDRPWTLLELLEAASTH